MSFLEEIEQYQLLMAIYGLIYPNSILSEKRNKTVCSFAEPTPPAGGASVARVIKTKNRDLKSVILKV